VPGFMGEHVAEVAEPTVVAHAREMVSRGKRAGKPRGVSMHYIRRRYTDNGRDLREGGGGRLSGFSSWTSA